MHAIIFSTFTLFEFVGKDFKYVRVHAFYGDGSCWVNHKFFCQAAISKAAPSCIGSLIWSSYQPHFTICCYLLVQNSSSGLELIGFSILNNIQTILGLYSPVPLLILKFLNKSSKNLLITTIKTCSTVKINYFGLSQVNLNFAYTVQESKDVNGVLCHICLTVAFRGPK